MSFFVYKAVDKKGKGLAGSAVALDQAEVLRDIKSRELFPVEVREVNEHEFYQLKTQLEKKRSFELFAMKKLKTKTLVFLLRDLSSMIGAGIVITRALEILTDQLHQKNMKELLISMRDIVSQGQPFSAALKKYPEYFPPLISEMITVGEQSGRLEEILNRLALFYERQEDIESRFKQAMIYPILIFSVALLSITAFLTIALPKIVSLYADLGTKLPAITLFLIALSNFMRHFWAFIFLFIFGLFTGLRYSMRFKTFRRTVHGLFLKVPLIGELFSKVIISRLLRAISAMYRSGISLLVIFQMLPQVVRNIIFEEAIIRIESAVRRGEGLSNAFVQEPIFPRQIANVIYVGEESGTLDTNLDRIAARFEEEVDRTTRTLSTLVEPFFIVMMGGFVLFIALALFMPLVKLVTTLSTE